MNDPSNETTAAISCDVPGCREEAAIGVGNERRCYDHALERANEIRASRGLPPIVVDDEGDVYVQH